MNGRPEGDGEVPPPPHRIPRAEATAVQLEHARMWLDGAGERARTFVRERPGTALLGALALGWIVGKLAARTARR